MLEPIPAKSENRVKKVAFRPHFRSNAEDLKKLTPIQKINSNSLFLLKISIFISKKSLLILSNKKIKKTFPPPLFF